MTEIPFLTVIFVNTLIPIWIKKHIPSKSPFWDLRKIILERVCTFIFILNDGKKRRVISKKVGVRF